MEDNRNLGTHEGEEQQPKTFTQEEVDEIVKKRLARERRKTGAEDGEETAPDRKTGAGDAKETAPDREKELDARELRIMAREKLQEAGMPMSLADVLRYSDEKSLEKAMEAVGNLRKEAPKGWGERMGKNLVPSKDPIREAMGLNRK